MKIGDNVWVKGIVEGWTSNGVPVVRLVDNVDEKRVSVRKVYGKDLILMR